MIAQTAEDRRLDFEHVLVVAHRGLQQRPRERSGHVARAFEQNGGARYQHRRTIRRQRDRAIHFLDAAIVERPARGGVTCLKRGARLSEQSRSVPHERLRMGGIFRERPRQLARS